jgi:hypothetical protein
MGFPEQLVDQSSLTPRQFESLSSYLRVASGEIKLREAASVTSQGRIRGRRDKPVSVGSYYRTVSQARTNLRKSVVTIVVALWLGAVRVEDVRRLFELVGSGARELPEDEAKRFLQLLDALLRHIVV